MVMASWDGVKYYIMKITKNTLKQLIKEELNNLAEGRYIQTQADLDAQAEATEAANRAAEKAKYGQDVKYYEASARVQIDLLTEIRDLLAQILAKGPV